MATTTIQVKGMTCGHCVIGSDGETQAARTDELLAAVARLVKS